MNQLLNSMNINISSPNDKRDLMIALFVVLFFGGLLWWILKPNFISSDTSLVTASDISISPEHGDAISTFVNNEGEENKIVENEDISIQKDKTSRQQIRQTDERIFTIVTLDDIERRTLEEASKNVEFKENSVELMRSSRPSLYRIAKIMKKYPDYQLRIIAYTKSPEKELALNRAEVCFNYLIGEEVESNRIHYKGKVYKENINITESNNDRVEFELSY